MKEYKLGQVAGLKLTATTTAIPGSAALFAVLALVAIGFLRLAVWEAILGSLLAVILHWTAAIAHQLGHARAARRTGYPMAGIRFGSFGLLAASRYPRGEPELPPAVHIRRALGGPLGSLLASLVSGLLVLLLAGQGGMPWFLALFFFLDNFLVFTLGSFLPLGFTDGSTLLQWRGRR